MLQDIRPGGAGEVSNRRDHRCGVGSRGRVCGSALPAFVPWQPPERYMVTQREFSLVEETGGCQVHELSLCHAIAGLARSAAGDRRIEIVRVQIGALRQVVPDSLSFSWELVRDHERMPDAELELDLVAAEVLCRSCDQRSEIESRWSLVCPNCESAEVEILRGNEFLVTSLDVS